MDLHALRVSDDAFFRVFPKFRAGCIRIRGSLGERGLRRSQCSGSIALENIGLFGFMFRNPQTKRLGNRDCHLGAWLENPRQNDPKISSSCHFSPRGEIFYLGKNPKYTGSLPLIEMTRESLDRNPELSASASFHLNLSVNRALSSRPKREILGSRRGIRSTGFLARRKMTTFKRA